MSDITELLRQCTVQLVVQNSKGSGFFVAPGLVLTCAHVVKDAQEKQGDVNVFWQNEKNCKADIKAYAPETDLALISVYYKTHPCVYLDTNVEIGDTLYSYGYPGESRAYGNYSKGDSLTIEYEGPSDNPFLLKLKRGQIVPGFSGSPALNLRTSGVCGVLSLTRGDRGDLGGRAIPVSTVLSEFSNIAQEQQLFHKVNKQWKAILPKQQTEGQSQYVTNNSQVINKGTFEQQFNINVVENLTVEK